MKVLFAASECVPFAKTGGLADVVGTLPKVLARGGVDARVIMPKYKVIPQEYKSKLTKELYFYVEMGWRRQYCGIESLRQDGVTYYFVDNEYYFGRDNIYSSGNDEGERFAFFCKAVLEALVRISFIPDVLHLNDWQTGLMAALLATQYRQHEEYKNIKALFTIHNLRYQGIFPWLFMDDLLSLGGENFTSDKLEHYGCVNCMKGGIVYSDRINTVSPTYAKEIMTPYFGERLDGLLRARSNVVSGILNGIDNAAYDPSTDPVIPEFFDKDHMEGKAACKRALQKELGLQQREDVPVVGMVSRLVDQKGIDLVECVINDIMRQDLQMIVLGTGDPRYHDLFNYAAWKYPGRFATRLEHSEPLSHRVFAGCDMFIVPSLFEPCGLTQMIAMRYGTLPIVRETGGLKDSVIPYNKFTGEGNGFSFANYNAHELLYTIERAAALYAQDKETWASLRKQAMEKDFSWDASAREYLKLYEDMCS